MENMCLFLAFVLLVIIGILLWMTKDSAKDAEQTPYGGTEVEDKKGEGP